MHPYATDSNERSKVNAGLAFLSVLAAWLLNRNISFPNSVSRRLRKYASLKDGHQSREFFEQFASWLAARKQRPTKASRPELARSNHSVDRGENA
jgi:hypothetical protein